MTSSQDEGAGIPHTRAGDGGIYLIVADETDEFSLALRYAARRATAYRGHVGILHVTSLEEFQHWGNVEKMMKQELREKAETFIWNAAQKAHDLNGMPPCLYLKEGSTEDAVIDTIKENPKIRMLILGGSDHSGGPGPLVSYFSGKGLHSLQVPLMIVPGHLNAGQIDKISG